MPATHVKSEMTVRSTKFNATESIRAIYGEKIVVDKQKKN